MIFGTPYAFVGLAAIAGLVAIYALRTRFRRYPVSSLMLWRATGVVRRGGIRREFPVAPPIFFLELAALAALLIAALTPLVRRSGMASLTVVFDNSASMAAVSSDGETPRDRSVQALRKVVRKGGYLRVRVLAAGGDIVGGVSATGPAEAIEAVASMPCVGTVDSLETALARAMELSAPGDDILVLSDKAPSGDMILRSGIRWLAFGSAMPNYAITLAERSFAAGGRSETALVEVSRYPEKRSSIQLTVGPLDGGPALFDGPLALGEDGKGRQWLELPPGAPDLLAEIPGDVLGIDNRALLLPEISEPLPVAVSFADPAMGRVFERGLSATGLVVLESDAPQLVFGDAAGAEAGGGAGKGVGGPGPWRFSVIRPSERRLTVGPYLADRGHPLLDGISFDGIAWFAGTNALPGRPLLLAGGAPLISLEQRFGREAELYLVSSNAQDSLYRSVAWPAFLDNLVRFCRESTSPGPVRRNLRAGVPELFAAPGNMREIAFDTPDGELRFPVRPGLRRIVFDVPGLYRMRLPGGGRLPFAVNFHAPSESDLGLATTGEWGAFGGVERLRRTHRPFAWLAGLIAVVLLVWHHFAAFASPLHIARDESGTRT